MYEIGLQQALTDELGITITGYYKDIRNLLASEIFIKNNFTNSVSLSIRLWFC